MKQIVTILLLTLGLLHAAPTDVATKDDIRQLIEHMDKRFEQVDKRFEQMQLQMDRRFEQIANRLTFIENVLLVLIGAMIGSPFVVDYIARRREEANRHDHERIEKILIFLKSWARNHPEAQKELEVTGLL